MKPKKSTKKDQNDSADDQKTNIRKGRVPKKKAKYRHKNHWLEQDDYDYDYSDLNNKDEEE